MRCTSPRSEKKKESVCGIPLSSPPLRHSVLNLRLCAKMEK